MLLHLFLKLNFALQIEKCPILRTLVFKLNLFSEVFKKYIYRIRITMFTSRFEVETFSTRVTRKSEYIITVERYLVFLEWKRFLKCKYYNLFQTLHSIH